MIRTLLIAALVAAMPATAVSAKDATEAGQPAKEKKICRRDPHTGSIMQRQICKTRAEWEAADAAARNGAVSHGGDSSRSVDVH